MLRSLVLWALIVVGAVSMIQYASRPSEEATEITLPRFQHELEQHNIDSLMVSGTHVHGVLRSPVEVRHDTVRHFSLLLPAETTDSFTAVVRRYGTVVAQNEDPARSWSVVLLTFGPYILIFGVGVLILVVWHRRSARLSE